MAVLSVQIGSVVNTAQSHEASVTARRRQDPKYGAGPGGMTEKGQGGASL